MKCVVCGKLLKPRQLFRITLYLVDPDVSSRFFELQSAENKTVQLCVCVCVSSTRQSYGSPRVTKIRNITNIRMSQKMNVKGISTPLLARRCPKGSRK